MQKRFKQSLSLWIIGAILLVPCGVWATDPVVDNDLQVHTAKMVTDAIMVRPLGIAATALGFCVFLVSSPFSLLGGNADGAWNTLVVQPAEFTFARPLGQFD